MITISKEQEPLAFVTRASGKTFADGLTVYAERNGIDVSKVPTGMMPDYFDWVDIHRVSEDGQHAFGWGFNHRKGGGSITLLRDGESLVRRPESKHGANFSPDFQRMLICFETLRPRWCEYVFVNGFERERIEGQIDQATYWDPDKDLRRFALGIRSGKVVHFLGYAAEDGGMKEIKQVQGNFTGGLEIQAVSTDFSRILWQAKVRNYWSVAQEAFLNDERLVRDASIKLYSNAEVSNYLALASHGRIDRYLNILGSNKASYQMEDIKVGQVLHLEDLSYLGIELIPGRGRRRLLVVSLSEHPRFQELADDEFERIISTQVTESFMKIEVVTEGKKSTIKIPAASRS